MSKINIFDEAKPGVFAKFEKVGDSVQGTYISKMKGKSKFSDQIIYTLQDEENIVWNVGFNLDKRVIHDRMDSILFGQIVGFRFDESRPTDKGNPAKIIRIYADPKHVDSEWLKIQKELGIDPNSGNNNIVVDVAEDKSRNQSMFKEPTDQFEVPGGAEPSSGGLSKEGEVTNTPVAQNSPTPLEAARSLAKTKGLIEDGMNEAMGDEAIEKHTGMKLTEENLTKIIISITGYTKK